MCGLYKEFSEFHKYSKGSGYQSYCKPCKKADDHKRHADNRVHRVELQKLRRVGLAAWMWQIKRENSCTDCAGFFHPIAMQWDHIEDNKEIEISNAVKMGWSTNRILQEVAKCELVCANCHAIRTYNRRIGV
jgi:hypothetical protein